MTDQKKPWYKKWWGISLIVFLVLIIISMFADPPPKVPISELSQGERSKLVLANILTYNKEKFDSPERDKLLSIYHTRKYSSTIWRYTTDVLEQDFFSKGFLVAKKDSSWLIENKDSIWYAQETGLRFNQSEDKLVQDKNGYWLDCYRLMYNIDSMGNVQNHYAKLYISKTVKDSKTIILTGSDADYDLVYSYFQVQNR